MTYRGEHLYVIDQRAYESRRLATVGDGHGNGHGNGHGVGAAGTGTEWGSLFGAGGSPPPAGSESPEFGYASPDTSGLRSEGSDSDSGSDAGSESESDDDDGAADARRSVSVPRDRVLSPRPQPSAGWDLFDDDPTHRPMERDDSAVRRYVGHRNVKTFLKSVAFMCDDAYVSTGSDCGGMFVWDARTCELVLKVQADSQVVNNVCPHPSLPMVVTSGIDDCMRVWEGGDGRHLIDLPLRNNSISDDDDDDYYDNELDRDDYDYDHELDRYYGQLGRRVGQIHFRRRGRGERVRSRPRPRGGGGGGGGGRRRKMRMGKRPFGEFARAEEAQLESDEAGGFAGGRRVRERRAEREETEGAALTRARNIEMLSLKNLTMTMQRTPPRLVRRLAPVEGVAGFQKQPP